MIMEFLNLLAWIGGVLFSTFVIAAIINNIINDVIERVRKKEK